MKKTAFLTIIILLVWALPAGAEVRYVTDEMKISVRKVPSEDADRIGIFSSGDKVEVLRYERGWAQVKLSDGKKGWVVSRYLVKGVPYKIRGQQVAAELKQTIALLQEENEAIKLELNDLKKENKEVNEKNQGLEAQMKDMRHQLEMENTSNYLGSILAGGGCVVVGVIIGVILILPRAGRHKNDLRLDI